MKRRISLLLVLILLLTMIHPQNVEAASIKISNSSAVVPVGMYKKISVSGTKGKVSWTTSNKSVATVSSSGTITGKKSGTATISAKAAGKTLRCKVTVVNRYNSKQVGNITVAAVRKYYKKAHLVEHKRNGNIIKLVIGRPQGDGAPGRTVIVNVSTGKAAWESDWDDFFDRMPRNFTLWNCKAIKRVAKITLNKTSASVVKGKTLTLKAAAKPSDATNKGVTWTSSNKKVATVTSKGVVKGVGYGTATISATAKDGSGKKATCKVTVKAATKAVTVPNVTNSILSLTAPEAAKKLGLTNNYGAGGTAIYLKGKKTSRRGSLQTRIKYRDNNKNKKGMWELFILDKSVSFHGAKVGMSKTQTNTILKKAKWKKTKEEKELSWDGYTNIYYKSTDSGSYAYKKKRTLIVRFDENGKIWMMVYYLD